MEERSCPSFEYRCAIWVEFVRGAETWTTPDRRSQEGGHAGVGGRLHRKIQEADGQRVRAEVSLKHTVDEEELKPWWRGGRRRD